MVTIDVPRPTELENVNDVEIEDLPRFAHVARERDPPEIGDVAAATRAAIDDIPALDDLDHGAEVAITAGSRGIHDMPKLVETAVDELADRGSDRSCYRRWGATAGGPPRASGPSSKSTVSPKNVSGVRYATR